MDYVFLEKGETLVLHGDSLLFRKELKKAKRIVIGHEHPAVSLKEGPRGEQFKCFLKGKYKGRNLIVQPSFNSIIVKIFIISRMQCFNKFNVF